ncbi:peptidoglycan D,D-transpeptidase FtsI family protein [Salsuginibacillus kocurii]|uniref:peptidoglycan D,D-transpeptidase FtsI family protein n=1 Tax=Salsuginibacillus kocurii TaxID=427078 RepID=UPI00036E5AC7|nr:penicillin-binding protein 2 [Salsuginibacillus kocurii]
MSKKIGRLFPTMRLNILFVLVFLIFAILILRLGYLQIVEGEEYQEMLNESQETTAEMDAPRGLMYDRHGNIVVSNELVMSVTYTNTPDNEEERIEVSHRLAEFIEVGDDDSGVEDLSVDDITEREIKDYWLQTREDEAEDLLTDEEVETAGNEGDELYDLQLERIGEDELNDIDDEELESVAIWAEMLGGYNYSPHRITSIDEETAHELSENLEYMDNVDLFRDSERAYPFGDTFPSFFGGTGSIPSENIDEYVAKGYERSDRVGTTFLEYQYEDYLRGEKGMIETIQEDGEESIEETEGSRGHDLVLSIDMALQQEIENIIQQEVNAASGTYINEEEAYVVLMDPQTGDLLSMAGYDDHLGTVSSAYEMGSSVKGATILAGLNEGVIEPGSAINDQPIDLPETPEISSWRNFGMINDLTALEVSSNVYMAEIAMRIAGFEEGSLGFAETNHGFQTLRNYYSQLGLGADTGVDLPEEMDGIEGEIQNPGELLFLSFGQFDTYTPLQLTQHIATIANDGYRMKPRLVQEVREPSNNTDDIGPVVKQHSPEVMNRIDATEGEINRVQEGLRLVVEGSEGTAASDFDDIDYTMAAKTGTAEITAEDPAGNVQDGNNQTLVGYAPYDDPEVAFAVVVPGAHGEDDGGRDGLANTIARQVLDAYFEVEEDRPDPDEADDGTSEGEYQEGVDPEDVEEEDLSQDEALDEEY